MPSVGVEIEGLTETLKAFQSLDRELRSQANGELRSAARECASSLVTQLTRAAGSCGVPVAPRVARSLRVKSDRLPVVTVGGSTRVGRRGAPAAALVWGSEQGPKGAVNHFGVGPSSGYWIAPTVREFAGGEAERIYLRSVVDIQRKYGLI